MLPQALLGLTLWEISSSDIGGEVVSSSLSQASYSKPRPALSPHPLQAVQEGVPGVDHPLAEEDPSYVQPAVTPPDI